MNMTQVPLAELRSLARLQASPEIQQFAQGEIDRRISAFAAVFRSASRTDYVGREHFDALAVTSKPSFRTAVSSMLFNQLLAPDVYGHYGNWHNRSGDKMERRLIFGLRPRDVYGIIVTATRVKADLGPYPDRLPCQTNYRGKVVVRNALENAIEVGSLVDLIDYGSQQMEVLHPNQPKNQAEHLSLAIAREMEA